jgi:DNA primase
MHRKEVTTEWAVAARRGKVFLDYNMKRRSASPAAPYSPRAVVWAGVSMPLTGDELEDVHPTQFDILNVPERLQRLGDSLAAHPPRARRPPSASFELASSTWVAGNAGIGADWSGRQS